MRLQLGRITCAVTTLMLCVSFTSAYGVTITPHRGTERTSFVLHEWLPACVCAHGAERDVYLDGFLLGAPRGGIQFPAALDTLVCVTGGVDCAYARSSPGPHTVRVEVFCECDHDYSNVTSDTYTILTHAPVLLIPGLCGNTNDWNVFAQVLIDSGFTVDRLQYGPAGYSLPPSANVAYLTNKLKAMDADSVAIVAHSMGGLIARDYMRKHHRNKDKLPKISQLITLGTPHHGIDLAKEMLSWDPFRTWLVGWKLEPCLKNKATRPALLDMLPGAPYLNGLNYGSAASPSSDSPLGHGWDDHESETTLPANVYIAAIGGTGTFCDPTTRKLLWPSGAAYHANDCTVATAAALLSNASAFRAADPLLALEKPAAHTRQAGPCNVAYYEFGTLARRVATMLWTSPAAPAFGPYDAPESRDAVLATVDDSLQLAPTITDSIPAGLVADRTVAIPATSLARFTLMSTDAHLSLVDPNGTAITVADTSALYGISFVSDPDLGLEGFEIVGPLPGTWTVRINTSASAEGQPVAAVVHYASAAKVAVSVTSSLIHPGDSIHVRGQVAQGGGLRTDLSWSVSLLRPDGASTPLILYDDGTHGDNLAGDGIYENVVTPAGGVGYYTISASASAPSLGPLAGVAYCQLADVQDLAVESQDIRLSRNVPHAGDSLTVAAVIHNNSSKAALGVAVEIRDLRADTLLATSVVDIAMSSAVTVQTAWVPAAPDSHEIEVQISPDVLDESDYTNNVASLVVVLGSPVGVALPEPRSTLRMDPPYPNPTNQRIVFSFSVGRSTAVSLAVFDVFGRRVYMRRWTALPDGNHSVEWDGHDISGDRVATGVYLCQLEVGGERLQRKFVLRR